MEVFIFTRSDSFGSNMYIVKKDGHAFLVDPSVPPTEVDEGLLRGITVDYLLLTHAHFDHMLEIEAWREQTGAPVIVGTLDVEALTSPTLNCYQQFLHRDGGYFGEYRAVDGKEVLPFAGDLIKVISAPGHTPGGVCYRIADTLFVGDLVFAGGGFGRYDLPGGNFRALRTSLAEFRHTEGNPIVYPGHGSPFLFEEAYHK